MKKWMIALLAFVLSCGIMAGVLLISWKNFTPQAIAGSWIQTTETNLKKVSEEWFDEFFQQYEGVLVPFDYRINDKKIDTIEILDQSQGYVQLDYSIRFASANNTSISYYGAVPQQDDWYSAQVVLKLAAEGDGYRITQKLSPVQYQIKSDSSLNESQPTTQYAMSDQEETYFFQQQKLYVTYDHGATSKEVPLPYEDIAGTNNGLYNEVLPSHGYLVSKAWTGFVAYDTSGSYLIYSKDQGATWNRLYILDKNYRGDSLYLSYTNTGCYVTLATDRSLGHEYYATFYTEDFKSWKQMDSEMLQGKEHPVFLDDGIVYAEAGYDEQRNACFYYSEDSGKTYQKYTVEDYSVEILGKESHPFIEMEYVYKKDGVTYMIIGQGPEGDYAVDRVIVKGLYRSQDGIHFTFEKNIDDSLTLAG